MEKVLMLDGFLDEIRDYGRDLFEVIEMGCFHTLVEEIEASPLLEIVRVKNRFDPTDNAEDSAGYRDYQLILRTEQGWLVELQIIPSDIYKLKRKLGHSDYTEYRHHRGCKTGKGVESDGA